MNARLIKKVFKIISEQTEPEINRVIIKLFNLLDSEKKQSKTKKELLEVIKKYAPYFNIPRGHELYLLELYMLNYREDGDYSGLTKDNFVDPRDMKGRLTPNNKSSLYTIAKLPFRGSNLEGFWKRGREGNKYYVIQSYGWYPVYIFRDGIWYENVDSYSSSTAKQKSHSRPYDYKNSLGEKVYLLTKDEMKMVENGVPHDEIMKIKREKLKNIEPELKSKRISRENPRGVRPDISVKFKIGSIEEEDDKTIVNVDIYDVVNRQIATPQNYLKGEIPNINQEKVEEYLTNRLKRDLINYIGTRFDETEDSKIEFKFNHLKK
jgi:hypothetical protein